MGAVPTQTLKRGPASLPERDRQSDRHTAERKAFIYFLCLRNGRGRFGVSMSVG